MLRKSGVLPGMEIPLSPFILNSIQPREPLLGYPRISSYGKDSQWGGPGGTTGGMPSIIHVLARSVECEGWDAGGSSAWLGEHPSSSGGGAGREPCSKPRVTQQYWGGTQQSSAVPPAFQPAGLAIREQCRVPRSLPGSCISEQSGGTFAWMLNLPKYMAGNLTPRSANHLNLCQALHKYI